MARYKISANKSLFLLFKFYTPRYPPQNYQQEALMPQNMHSLFFFFVLCLVADQSSPLSYEERHHLGPSLSN